MNNSVNPTWGQVNAALVEMKNNRFKSRCSAHERGVFFTAEEMLLETMERHGGRTAKAINREEAFLGGAPNWQRYAEGACSQCFTDEAIAKRYCTPSELKKTKNGERKPNKDFDWIDVEANACFAAWRKICIAYHNAKTSTI